jgi:ferredoxin-nitrate reductase
MLDRFAGPNPPKCVVIDPRKTPTAELATVHLAPIAGTNLALLNGIQRQMFERGYIDEEYIKAHTIGIDELRKTVEGYTPERVFEITGVPPEQLIEAVEILGQSKTVLATALQGVYQSNQATASACQINNIQLLRGNIGKPGGGIYQVGSGPAVALITSVSYKLLWMR